MHAVILAGGKGQRLAPYTISFPKPMVPISDMPILEIVIRQLRGAGFYDITLAVGHLAELLMAYFQDGARWGINLEYSRELTPLGTVGPLLLIDDLPENFIVMNGDVLTTLKYGELHRFHLEAKADLTIAVHRCNMRIDLGVIEFDSRLQVTGYREKPSLPYDVSMGVYVFNRSVLKYIPADGYMDFPLLVQRLIDDGKTVKVYLTDSEWLDIGRPSDYAVATKRFESMRDAFLSSDSELSEVIQAAQ